MGIRKSQGEAGSRRTGGRRSKKLIAYAEHYTDPYAQNCARCRQEERIYGIKPNCEECEAANRLPELHINNVLVWEVYRIVAGMGTDIKLDLMRLIDRLGVKQPLVVIRKIGIIHRIALKNWEKSKSGQ
jgi:hypothetical protein